MVTTMRQWVVGFLFDDEATHVVLIQKNRPEWQAGKLNGVGGKVEESDLTIGIAMDREFREETGVTGVDWNLFASLTWEEGIVYFFRGFDTEAVWATRSMTDEKVDTYYTNVLPLGKLIPNLKWLVPLAAHRHDSYDVIDVVETGTTLRKPGRLDVFPSSPRRRFATEVLCTGVDIDDD